MKQVRLHTFEYVKGSRNMNEWQEFLPYVFYVLGVAGRVVLPYLKARLDADEPFGFDWRYVAGQLVTAVIVLIPLLGSQEYLAQLGGLSYLGTLLVGWGASDVGRLGQKFTNMGSA